LRMLFVQLRIAIDSKRVTGIQIFGFRCAGLMMNS